MKEKTLTLNDWVKIQLYKKVTNIVNCLAEQTDPVYLEKINSSYISFKTLPYQNTVHIFMSHWICICISG